MITPIWQQVNHLPFPLRRELCSRRDTVFHQKGMPVANGLSSIGKALIQSSGPWRQFTQGCQGEDQREGKRGVGWGHTCFHVSWVCFNIFNFIQCFYSDPVNRLLKGKLNQSGKHHCWWRPEDEGISSPLPVMKEICYYPSILFQFYFTSWDKNKTSACTDGSVMIWIQGCLA